MADFAVILPAAGRSSRFGDPKQKKVYAELDGRAVWLRAIDPFLQREDVGQVLVAIAPEDRELFERRYQANVVFLNIKVIEGGAERHDTIAKALEHIDPSCTFIAVHDAARPCVSREVIDAVFAAAREFGAALPGLPVSDTLKRVDSSNTIVSTIPRADLRAVQTPQAFRRDWLEAAYRDRQRLSAGSTITDDAQLVEALGHACKVVTGSPFNLKITTPEDLLLARLILQSLPEPKRDAPAHPFADEKAGWENLPKVKLNDLFPSME